LPERGLKLGDFSFVANLTESIGGRFFFTPYFSGDPRLYPRISLDTLLLRAGRTIFPSEPADHCRLMQQPAGAFVFAIAVMECKEPAIAALLYQ